MSTTVLIVDDHPGFRSMARRMLQAGGWDVIGEAGTAAEGVAAAAALHPDVVLLDLHLPDASGLSIVAQLTAVPAVVLTSTHEEHEIRVLAVDSGARGFVPKSLLSGEALAAAVAGG